MNPKIVKMCYITRDNFQEGKINLIVNLETL